MRLSRINFYRICRREPDLLLDDMEAKGPIRVSEVESAQIMQIARKLSDDGEIMLAGAEKLCLILKKISTSG